MRITIISFTDAGSQLNAAVNRLLTEKGAACASYTVKRFAKHYGLHPLKEDMKSWIGTLWGNSVFLFIGASGIAVRYIAPWVKDKFTDSPVIIMDEKGEFVIPLLSGHIGGAVEIARFIAECTHAIPVVTTATDVQHKFAVDVFAKQNGLKIDSRRLAKEISAALLEGKEVGIYSDLPGEGTVPDGLKCCRKREELKAYPYGIYVTDRTDAVLECDNILNLYANVGIIVGIGCRRGTPKEQLEMGLKKVLDMHGILPEQVCAFASIELKKDEKGLLELAKEYKVPFRTFSAGQLNTIKDVSSHSTFVAHTTGVDNVCERAARLYSEEGELLQPKICLEGSTFALVKQKRKVVFAPL